MNILISPYSHKLRNGNRNAKNYPFWEELILLLKDHRLIQIGIEGEERLCEDFRAGLSMKQIVWILREANLFISVDNFLPHMAHHYGKRGIVVFSQSDPEIFGYKENINIIKDRKFLRTNQFDSWELCPYNKEAFESPQEILKAVNLFTLQK